MLVDRLALLEHSRDKLFAAMEDPELKPADLAALSRELRAVLLEIEKIPGSGEVTPLDRLADDLEERRRRRQTG
jgi:hypothetical protein